MMFPFYSLTMLGFESASVINKRLAKIGRGGTQSVAEISLMFAEKADATIEVIASLMIGTSPAGIIGRFREQVAANETRLSN